MRPCLPVILEDSGDFNIANVMAVVTVVVYNMLDSAGPTRPNLQVAFFLLPRAPFLVPKPVIVTTQKKSTSIPNITWYIMDI